MNSQEFIIKPCVYILTHDKTGKFYIGSTKRLGNRFANHIRNLRNGNHHCRNFQAVYDEDHSLSLQFEYMEDRDQAYCKEQELLTNNRNNPLLLNSNLKTGYRSEQTNLNLSLTMKNRSQELKNKSIAALRKHQPKAEHWVGRKHRPETIQKMKESSRSSPASQKRLAEMLVHVSKPVMAEGVLYSSASEASRIYNLYPSTIIFRCRSDNPLFKDFYFV